MDKDRRVAGGGLRVTGNDAGLDECAALAPVAAARKVRGAWRALAASAVSATRHIKRLDRLRRLIADKSIRTSAIRAEFHIPNKPRNV